LEAPYERIARLLDDEGERIEHHQGAQCFRHGRQRVEHRRQKHHDGGEEPDGLPDIAQEYAERGQHPGQAEAEQDQREQDEGDENRRPEDVALEQHVGGEQYAEADRGVEQGCAHGDHGQDFQREYHLLHVIHIGEDHAGGAVEGFGEEAVHDHADEHHHGKAGVAFFSAIAPARLEHDRKNEGVDGQHQQGREEGPGQPHERPLVAAEHLAPGHLIDELAVAPEAPAQGRGGCELGGVGVH
jgi:hypothetical protein